MFWNAFFAGAIICFLIYRCWLCGGADLYFHAFLVLINMVLNVEHCKDFGKIKDGLMKLADERHINIWKTILPKIRRTLLH